MQTQLARNIPLFYLLRGLTLPYFWLPLLYYYLTAIKGFSVAETTILLGLQEFLLIFLEVPTGVVADKISRKFSVGLGIAITSLPLALLPLVSTYSWALVIFATRAIGKALVSGADSSLLYDTLLDLGRTNEYKKIKTQSAAVVMGVTAICIFIGGWMGEMGLYNLALILPFPLQLIAAFAVYLMIEPESSKQAQKIQESNYVKHIWQAVRIVVTNRTVLILALAFAVLEGTAVNMKWYYPAIFESLQFGLSITGMLMSVLYIAKTAINAIGSKLILRDAQYNTLLWTSIIASAWLVSAWFTTPVVVLPILVLILLGLELAINSSEELIHDTLESGVRATAMSFVNLLSSVAATALLWIWGISIEIQSVAIAIGVQGMIAVVIALLLMQQGLARRRTVS